MNTSIDALTESIVENGKSILAATIVVQGQGERPHRVILHYWRGEFVTHMEILDKTCQPPMGDPCIELFEHHSYDQGHYFGQDFDNALRDFHARSAVLLRSLARKAF